MNKVKFKSPSGKVTLARVTQTHAAIDRRKGYTVAETNRYMVQQGFVRCGLRAS